MLLVAVLAGTEGQRDERENEHQGDSIHGVGGGLVKPDSGMPPDLSNTGDARFSCDFFAGHEKSGRPKGRPLFEIRIRSDGDQWQWLVQTAFPPQVPQHFCLVAQAPKKRAVQAMATKVNSFFM